MADECNIQFDDDELGCSSSSFEESSDYSDQESQLDALPTRFSELGVRPYQFEPERSPESTSGSDAENEAEFEEAVGTVWCICGNCQVMATATECRCCRRIGEVLLKMEEFETETGRPLGCISEHPGFMTVCLDRYVLETAYFQYRQQFGDMHPDDDNRQKKKLQFQNELFEVREALLQSILGNIIIASFRNCLFLFRDIRYWNICFLFLIWVVRYMYLFIWIWRY